jgi:hypothetical protein
MDEEEKMTFRDEEPGRAPETSKEGPIMSTVRWVVRGLFGLPMAVVVLLSAATALAQSPDGPFERLSPGNQRIASALFEAQRSDLPPGTQALTLDEIATLRLEGRGWGEVFHALHAEGRVEARNLGQVVSEYNERHRPGLGPDTRTDRLPARRNDAVNRGPARAGEVGALPAGLPREVAPGVGHGVGPGHALGRGTAPGLGTGGAPAHGISGTPGLGAGHGVGRGR